MLKHEGHEDDTGRCGRRKKCKGQSEERINRPDDVIYGFTLLSGIEKV